MFNMASGITNGMSADYVFGVPAGNVLTLAGDAQAVCFAYDETRKTLFMQKDLLKIAAYDDSGVNPLVGTTADTNSAFLYEFQNPIGPTMPCDMVVDESAQKLYVGYANPIGGGGGGRNHVQVYHTAVWKDGTDYYAGNVPIHLAATAPAANTVSAVEWNVNGGAWQSTTLNVSTGLYEAVWDSTSLADGTITLNARTTYTGGAPAVTTSSTFKTDNTTPATSPASRFVGLAPPVGVGIINPLSPIPIDLGRYGVNNPFTAADGIRSLFFSESVGPINTIGARSIMLDYTNSLLYAANVANQWDTDANNVYFEQVGTYLPHVAAWDTTVAVPNDPDSAIVDRNVNVLVDEAKLPPTIDIDSATLTYKGTFFSGDNGTHLLHFIAKDRYLIASPVYQQRPTLTHNIFGEKGYILFFDGAQFRRPSFTQEQVPGFISYVGANVTPTGPSPGSNPAEKNLVEPKAIALKESSNQLFVASHGGTYNGATIRVWDV
jgi:hypothetical protein